MLRPVTMTVGCRYCAWTAEAPGETPLTSVRWLKELATKHLAAMHPERVPASAPAAAADTPQPERPA